MGIGEVSMQITPPNHNARQLSSASTETQQLEQQRETITQQTQGNDIPLSRPPRFDEYVKDEKTTSSAGIYHVEQDEAGNPLILLDQGVSPKDSARADGEKPEVMKTTVSTDKIDAELNQLKERQQMLEQQLKQIGDHPEKKAAIEQQLAALKADIKMKSSDAYRKQNASYTHS